MKMRFLAFVSVVLAMGACSNVGDLASTEADDTTDLAAFPDRTQEEGGLLSAFYGLDDGVPFLASYRICNTWGLKDGMPVVFSKEVDVATVQAGDFSVTLADGTVVPAVCATPAPAEDLGEFRTILLLGDFGSGANQPVTVEITGHIISLDHSSDFKGTKVQATPLEDGPFLVHAEVVAEADWEIGKQATRLPFGGGDACPGSSAQVVRAVWAGGVTKPGGDEVDDLERAAYKVIVEAEAGEEAIITPFALGDLSDGDNNHELCLDVDRKVLRIEFPAGLMTDPRDDLNVATSIAVSS